MKMRFKEFLICFGILFLTSCNIFKNTDPLIIEIPNSPTVPVAPKETEPGQTEAPKNLTQSAADLSYSQVNEEVLKPKCLQCHSGKYEPDLTTYKSVLDNKEKIYEQSIHTAKMPKGNIPLTEDERWILKTSLDSNAPELSARGLIQPPLNTEKPISLIERPVRWDKVNNEIIQKYCLACHFTGNKDGISSYEDYETTKATIATIFYYVSIASAMPPAPADLVENTPNPNQLTQEQKDLLAAWITDGMKR